MSCVMGNRLILNVRHMKRDMEESIEGREKSILQLPFTANDDEGDRTPSRVVFAQRRSTSTGFATQSQGEIEFIELRDLDKEPHRHTISL